MSRLFQVLNLVQVFLVITDLGVKFSQILYNQRFFYPRVCFSYNSWGCQDFMFDTPVKRDRILPEFTLFKRQCLEQIKL